MSLIEIARPAAPVPAVRIAVADISAALDRLHGEAQYLAGERDTARRELEEARRETGKHRARAEAAENLLREAISFAEGGEAYQGELVWRAREALGLDPKTGHRDVRESDVEECYECETTGMNCLAHRDDVIGRAARSGAR